MAEQQVIPARHGTATFVPAGSILKVVNTSGTQVVDTWAFALPKPDGYKKGSQEEKAAQDEAKKSKAAPAKKKGTADLPNQEDAENATNQGIKEGEEANAADASQQKRTWGSYVPSIGWSSNANKKDSNQSEQQKDSKTWSSYFPSGKGFSTYIPSSAKDTVSTFAASVRLRKVYVICLLLTRQSASTRPQQKLHGTATRTLEDTGGGGRIEQ